MRLRWAGLMVNSVRVITSIERNVSAEQADERLKGVSVDEIYPICPDVLGKELMLAARDPVLIDSLPAFVQHHA